MCKIIRQKTKNEYLFSLTTYLRNYQAEAQKVQLEPYPDYVLAF